MTPRAGGLAGSGSAATPYQLADCGALTAQLHRGEVDPRQLVDLALARIEEVDSSGPQLSSIVAVADGARAAAGAMTGRIRHGQPAGPLTGIPVVVKDNIDTADMPTTAGSLALAAHPPAADAPVVAALRTAGAIVVGKANLSEWGNFRASRSTRGWSAVGGLVRNPHRLDRSAGGSSSGSAAAVAAGIVPLALGTETDRSIIGPAEMNGIVGLKPTVGLLPAAGVVPISSHQDTVGPLARTVRDVALALDVMALRPPATAGRRRTAAATYVQCCLAPNPTDLRVGVLDVAAHRLHPASATALENSIAALAAAGVGIVDGLSLPGAAELRESGAELTVMLYDLRHDLDRYLARRGHPGIGVLEDVIAFNLAHADQELRYFGQDLFERAAQMGPRDEPEYRLARAIAVRCGGAEGIDHAVSGADVDCLLIPGYGPAWKSDLVNGDGPSPGAAGSIEQSAAVAGYPLLTVPAGECEGLPVGVTLMGPALAEPAMLRVAAVIERHLDCRLTPSYRPVGAG